MKRTRSIGAAQHEAGRWALWTTVLILLLGSSSCLRLRVPEARSTLALGDIALRWPIVAEGSSSGDPYRRFFSDLAFFQGFAVNPRAGYPAGSRSCGHLWGFVAYGEFTADEYVKPGALFAIHAMGPSGRAMPDGDPGDPSSDVWVQLSKFQVVGLDPKPGGARLGSIVRLRDKALRRPLPDLAAVATEHRLFVLCLRNADDNRLFQRRAGAVVTAIDNGARAGYAANLLEASGREAEADYVLSGSIRDAIAWMGTPRDSVPAIVTRMGRACGIRQSASTDFDLGWARARKAVGGWSLFRDDHESAVPPDSLLCVDTGTLELLECGEFAPGRWLVCSVGGVLTLVDGESSEVRQLGFRSRE